MPKSGPWTLSRLLRLLWAGEASGLGARRSWQAALPYDLWKAIDEQLFIGGLLDPA